MTAPTYGGIPIFQFWCTVTTPAPTRQMQTFTYFGLPTSPPVGLLDGGSRGAETSIIGTLFGSNVTAYFGGPTPGSLAAAEQLVRSYQDGQARDFTDSYGTLWPNVQLIRFQPYGRIGQSQDGRLFRKFTARLRHLSP